VDHILQARCGVHRAGRITPHEGEPLKALEHVAHSIPIRSEKRGVEPIRRQAGAQRREDLQHSQFRAREPGHGVGNRLRIGESLDHVVEIDDNRPPREEAPGHEHLCEVGLVKCLQVRAQGRGRRHV
jgi:hypothetical protein